MLKKSKRIQIFRAIAATILGACIAWVNPVHAQSSQTALPSANAVPNLSQALDAAWAQDANARTAQSKLAEITAKQNAGSSWIAGSPNVTLGHRSDRLNQNGGLREYEAQIDVPLSIGTARSATQRQLDAQVQYLQQTTQLAKFKIAGLLRTLAADYALAQIEHTLAERKIAESELLYKDIERRLRAGDVARLDALQAQANTAQAKGQASAALGQKQRLQAQWQSTTGLPVVAQLTDDIATNIQAPLDQHPTLLAAQSQLHLAQTRLQLAEADRRDPMELGIGLVRGRSAFGNAAESNMRISLRIPLGNDNRNMPRITGARAELDLAQAELDAAQRNVNLEINNARSFLVSNQQLLSSAQQRAQFAMQAYNLIAQAYRLGERDLQARLRADSEKNDAELAAMRAQLEQRRAAANLQQALGLFP